MSDSLHELPPRDNYTVEMSRKDLECLRPNKEIVMMLRCHASDYT